MNSSYGGERMNINIVNNYYKPGPATVTGSKRGRIFAIDATENRNGGYLWGKYYIDGNVVDGGQMIKTAKRLQLIIGNMEFTINFRIIIRK